MKKKYLGFIAIGRFDIVHNINVNIVQDNTGLRHPGSFPKYTAEDDTGLGRRHLEGKSRGVHVCGMQKIP